MEVRRILPHRKLTRQEIWNMKRLWRMVPHVQCKGLCTAACTNVPLFPAEALYLIEKYDAKIMPGLHGSADPAHPPMLMPTLGLNQPCQFLKNGRCSIYDDRPSVCREYGHKVLTLDCGHDCKARVPLTNEHALDLMASHIVILNFDLLKKPREDWFGELDRQVDEMLIEVATEDDEALPEGMKKGGEKMPGEGVEKSLEGLKNGG